jgi:hypothetical protein
MSGCLIWGVSLLKLEEIAMENSLKEYLVRAVKKMQDWGSSSVSI